MFSIPKQFSAATRNELSSQLTAFNTLASKTVEALEKLMTLNIETVKATRAESMNAAQKILSAQTPQQFISATSERLQANVQTFQSYARHLAEVSAGTQAEFIKIAQMQKTDSVKIAPVAAPVVKLEPVPAIVQQSANDEPVAELVAEAEPVLAPVPVDIAVEEPAPAPKLEAAPEKPTAEAMPKKPATSKPQAKAAPAKPSAASSFPNPGVKSLVKKPATDKSATSKTAVTSKKLTKPSAKKKA